MRYVFTFVSFLSGTFLAFCHGLALQGLNRRLPVPHPRFDQVLRRLRVARVNVGHENAAGDMCASRAITASQMAVTVTATAQPSFPFSRKRLTAFREPRKHHVSSEDLQPQTKNQSTDNGQKLNLMQGTATVARIHSARTRGVGLNRHHALAKSTSLLMTNHVLLSIKHYRLAIKKGLLSMRYQ